MLGNIIENSPNGNILFVFPREETGLLHPSSIFLLPFMMGCYIQLESDFMEKLEKNLEFEGKENGVEGKWELRLNKVLKA